MEIFCFKTHIGYFHNFAGAKIDDIAVGAAINTAFVEGHDILGEGARLIGEYILDLAQFFIEGGGTGFGMCFGWFVIHFFIPIY